MATYGTYYLNGPTLSSSTAVFTDAALSVCAPDGFYSDGSIVREQVGCSLLPDVVCPSCASPCNTSIVGSGGQGVYYIDTQTGTNTGAIILKFNPFGVPDGILAQLGPNLYNGMSSSNYGWLQGSAGLPTYVGEISSDCGILAGSPYPSVTEYEYQGTGFVNLGTTTNITVTAGQLDFTVNPPGMCTIVIPKTSNAYTVLNTQIIGLCPGTGFDIQIECPDQLSTWMGSVNAATGAEACLLNIATTYYYVHVNGSGGVLGLYDMVFSDANGEFPLAAGYYNTGSMSTSYNWIQVDSNGVIIAFGVCTEEQNYIAERCYTDNQVVISAPGTLIPGDFVLVSEYPGCVFEVISTTTDPTTATFLSSTTGDCTSQCASWEVTNPTTVPITFDYEDCGGSTIYFELGPNQTVYICARQLTTTPPGLLYGIDLCECDAPFVEIWGLQGCCNGDIVTALGNVPVNIGDLVKVTDTNLQDCWYEVVAGSLGTPTTTIYLSNNGAFDCSQVCCKYQVCNADPVDSHSVTYTDCDGLPSNINLPPSTCIFVCARSGSFGPTVLTITFESCTC